MNYILDQVLESYASCDLSASLKVNFRNRTDTKYLADVNTLVSVLADLSDAYFISEIDFKRIHPYETMYFDLPNDELFFKHHNKNYPRYKFRKRYYPLSSDAFLEIKVKSNKKITTKIRLRIEECQDEFTPEQSDFIHYNTGVDTMDLSLVMTSGFNRITLVRKDFEERCTIDTGLYFNSNGEKVNLNGVVIFEVKKERNEHNSLISSKLKEHSIRPTGFSKYCIGRALTNPQLKRNYFKPQLKYVSPFITTYL